MSRADEEIGRVYTAGGDGGANDNTLGKVSADHGEQLGDHWMLGKDGYFDGAFHIPLLMRDPRAAPTARGRAVDAFTEAVDVMPTILGWLDLAIPPQFDGRSRLPFLASTTPTGWRRQDPS